MLAWLECGGGRLVGLREWICIGYWAGAVKHFIPGIANN